MYDVDSNENAGSGWGEYVVSFTFVFEADELDMVLDAVGRLPDDLRDVCFAPEQKPVRLEIDVEAMGASYQQVVPPIREHVLREIAEAGVPGRLVALNVSDELGFEEWTF